MPQHYDYIISGSGCAGLSMLYRMINHSFFNEKKILVIDKSFQKTNDKTWCFWETQPGVFEQIVHHKWKQTDFYSNSFSARYDLAPYEYKMIRSIDFYNHVLYLAHQNPNVQFLSGIVQSVTTQDDKAFVIVNNITYSGDYLFNSIFSEEEQIKSLAEKGKIYSLLQHFKGWLIETDNPSFNDKISTFMDFRVSQQRGAAFVYFLPVSATTALIEYTLFTKKLLQQQEYDEALKQYITQYVKLKNYSIKEQETGVIPMTSYRFSKGDGKIINIGTAGGQTKASSGFTFRFIQKHADAVLNAIINGKDPLQTFPVFKKRFKLYDNTLLNILQNKKMSADDIFAKLFEHNPVQRVLKFLDNETNLSDELKIMRSVPAKIFLPAAMHELFT